MGGNELFAYSRAKLFDILDDGENVDEQVYFRFSSSFIKTFPIIHDEITEKMTLKSTQPINIDEQQLKNIDDKEKKSDEK